MLLNIFSVNDEEAKQAKVFFPWKSFWLSLLFVSIARLVMLARDQPSGLFVLFISDEKKQVFLQLMPVLSILKHFFCQ